MSAEREILIRQIVHRHRDRTMSKQLTGILRGDRYIFKHFKCPSCEVEGEWPILLSDQDNIHFCPAECGQAFMLEEPTGTAPPKLSPVHAP